MVSLRRRLLISTLIGSVVLTLTTGLFLSIIFKISHEKQFDQRLANTLSELVGATRITDKNISLNLLHSSPQYYNLYSGWYWQIVLENEILFKSKSLQKSSIIKQYDIEQYQDGIFRGNIDGPIGEPIRVYAQYISFPELNKKLLFIVSGNSELLNAQEKSFYWMISSALTLLVFGLIGGTFYQLRFVLKPLTSLKNYLAKIRIGEGQSIEGDLPIEIMPVANEINSLIDANKKVIDRARTHVGNLAHALKTPISVLLNETDNKDDAKSKLIHGQVKLMNVQITHHLNRARMTASLESVATKIPVSPIVNSIVNVLQKINVEKNVKVELNLNKALCFHGEKQDLEELIGNLIDNAFKWCGNKVLVTITSTENKFKILQLHIMIEDDGQFMPPKELERVLKRGHRIDENVTGSGLGLSIVKELAGLYNGEFKLSQSNLGGLKAELWLPLA